MICSCIIYIYEVPAKDESKTSIMIIAEPCIQGLQMHETSSSSSKNIQDSDDANLLQEITAGEVGEVDSELQAEHFIVFLRVRVDNDSKFRRWNLLGKFNSLGDVVVARLDRALDLHVCFFTTCRVEGFDEDNEGSGQRQAPLSGGMTHASSQRSKFFSKSLMRPSLTTTCAQAPFWMSVHNGRVSGTSVHVKKKEPDLDSLKHCTGSSNGQVLARLWRVWRKLQRVEFDDISWESWSRVPGQPSMRSNEMGLPQSK